MNYSKLIALGAAVALVGYILSGPVTFIIVNLLQPQPAWVSSAVFVSNYSILQDLPYYFGFLLIGGMLMVAAGHYLNYSSENTLTKFHLLVALGWTVVFCGLISFNYVCQTTFIHNLVLNYKPEYDSPIAAFSMANPLSFCWANEMWGYALLGVATWLMAGYYKGKSRLISILLILNGVLSILGALLTIADINWVMTPWGLRGYFLWNVLMISLMFLIYRKHAHKRLMVNTGEYAVE